MHTGTTRVRKQRKLYLTNAAYRALQRDAAANGITISDAVEQYALGRPVRAQSRTAVALQPIVQLSYLLAVDSPLSAVAQRQAQEIIAALLRDAQPAFKAEIVASTPTDDWSG